MIVHPASPWWWMTRNPSTRFGEWLHKRATAERVETIKAEPEWLPQDRDVVDMYLVEQKSRRACGHWPWQEGEIEGFEPGYTACGVCGVIEPYKEKVRKQNRKRGKDQHGLTFGLFPPRGDDSGD